MAELTGPISHVALADAVYDRIIQQIMDGTLRPGSPLRIAPMAATAGVSHTPVREALARLEGTGLVQRLSMRGFIVAPPMDGEALRQLTDVRILIEPRIAELACRNASPELVARLEESQRVARSTPGGQRYEDYRSYLDASTEFHSIIGDACGNPFLLQALSALPVHVQRFRLFGKEGVTDAEISIAEHQHVLDAIAAHDPEAAREAMRDHVEGVHARATAGAATSS